MTPQGEFIDKWGEDMIISCQDPAMPPMRQLGAIGDKRLDCLLEAWRIAAMQYCDIATRYRWQDFSAVPERKSELDRDGTWAVRISPGWLEWIEWLKEPEEQSKLPSGLDPFQWTVATPWGNIPGTVCRIDWSARCGTIIAPYPGSQPRWTLAECVAVGDYAKLVCLGFFADENGKLFWVSDDYGLAMRHHALAKLGMREHSVGFVAFARTDELLGVDIG